MVALTCPGLTSLNLDANKSEASEEDMDHVSVKPLMCLSALNTLELRSLKVSDINEALSMQALTTLDLEHCSFYTMLEVPPDSILRNLTVSHCGIIGDWEESNITINITNCSSLEKLYFEISGEGTVFVGQCPSLKAIVLRVGEMPPSFDLTCPELKELELKCNSFPSLVTLDCPKLQTLEIHSYNYGMPETRIETLNLSGCTSLAAVDIEPTCVESVPPEWVEDLLTKNPELRSGPIIDKLTRITHEHW
eukprot:CAMPEP_0184367006 /NCGR_PEP_ID=MMETSP1089-20130417/156475_1 /TAXON_ID=38269 ORGANISM="Gloeochaete wittrockiana, Strain SAG46.84" /NCGR_SAMPLE_ID=MMETSP1089 /ASSEMBLY_ACC=CAM_ASM_000445 /LENGTH=249 /DNA_ID=CAMNT_0026708835 /DNA_START=740 /DNA_END=1486 /DNA_ORIENTATION=+